MSQRTIKHQFVVVRFHQQPNFEVGSSGFVESLSACLLTRAAIRPAANCQRQHCRTRAGVHHSRQGQPAGRWSRWTEKYLLARYRVVASDDRYRVVPP